MASSSDKSSGVKSTSIPSTPQADSMNIHMEARNSHSLQSDSTPADPISDMKHNNEAFEPDDNYLVQEASLVCHKELLFISSELLPNYTAMTIVQLILLILCDQLAVVVIWLTKFQFILYENHVSGAKLNN